jgi:hypothetical protein
MKLPFVPIRLSSRGFPEVTPLTAQAVIFDASFVSWSSMRTLRGQRQRDAMLLTAFAGESILTSPGYRLLRVVYQYPLAMRRFLLERSSRGDL